MKRARLIEGFYQGRCRAESEDERARLLLALALKPYVLHTHSLDQPFRFPARALVLLVSQRVLQLLSIGPNGWHVSGGGPQSWGQFHPANAPST
jgi:hypothetical protein